MCNDPIEELQNMLDAYELIPRIKLEDWINDYGEEIHNAFNWKEFIEKIPNYPPSERDPNNLRFIHIDILRNLKKSYKPIE